MMTIECMLRTQMVADCCFCVWCIRDRICTQYG